MEPHSLTRITENRHTWGTAQPQRAHCEGGTIGTLSLVPFFGLMLSWSSVSSAGAALFGGSCCLRAGAIAWMEYCLSNDGWAQSASLLAKIASSDLLPNALTHIWLRLRERRCELMHRGLTRFRGPALNNSGNIFMIPWNNNVWSLLTTSNQTYLQKDFLRIKLFRRADLILFFFSCVLLSIFVFFESGSGPTRRKRNNPQKK